MVLTVTKLLWRVLFILTVIWQIIIDHYVFLIYITAAETHFIITAPQYSHTVCCVDTKVTRFVQNLWYSVSSLYVNAQVSEKIAKKRKKFPSWNKWGDFVNAKVAKPQLYSAKAGEWGRGMQKTCAPSQRPPATKIKTFPHFLLETVQIANWS